MVYTLFIHLKTLEFFFVGSNCLGQDLRIFKSQQPGIQKHNKFDNRQCILSPYKDTE
jgi:hypothetical protein